MDTCNVTKHDIKNETKGTAIVHQVEIPGGFTVDDDGPYRPLAISQIISI